MTKLSKDNFFLVLGGGKNSIFLLTKLNEMGCKSILVDRDQNCPSKDFSNIFIQCSTWDPEQIISKTTKHPYKLCITRSSGHPAYSAIYINKHKNIVNTNPEIVLSILDKKSIYELDLSKIVLQPKIFLKSSLPHVLKNAPVICKPALEKIGKVSTFLIKDPSTIEEMTVAASKNSHNTEVVYQEYVEGYDISMLGYITGKVYKSSVIFEEKNKFSNGFLQHSGFSIKHDPLLIARLKEIAQAITEEFDLNFCPFNLSFRISNEKIYLIEVNLDFSGEGLLELLLARHNIDIVGDFIFDSNSSINI